MGLLVMLRSLAILAFGLVLGAAIGIYAVGNRQSPLASEFLHQISHSPRAVDLSRMGVSHWRILCVFGPYVRPSSKFAELAKNEGIDVSTLRETGELPPQELSQTDSYLAIVSDDDTLEWASLYGRVIVANEHSAECISRDKPVLTVPVSKSVLPAIR